MSEQLGALFLLLWETVPRERWAATTIVLLNRAPPPPALVTLFSGFRAVLLLPQLSNTCFADLIVGTGCRAVWWQSDKLAFESPVYADFLGLLPPPDSMQRHGLFGRMLKNEGKSGPKRVSQV